MGSGKFSKDHLKKYFNNERSNNMSYSCNKCKDQGSYEENGSSITCIFCGGKQKFIVSLTTAMRNAKAKGNKKLYRDLRAINKLLPEYPVMAVFEAEGRKIDPSLISFIRQSFDVKAFHEPTNRGV